MTETAVLGFDLGSGSTRVAVCGSDGRAKAVVETRTDRSNPDWFRRQSAESLFDDALGGARLALSEAGEGVEVACIAVGAFGPTPVAIDADHQSVFPLSPYSLDPASHTFQRRLVEDFGQSEREITQDHPLPKVLAWKELQPGAWGRVVSVVDLASYIVLRLTGALGVDNITAADYEALERLTGLPLPPVYRPTDTPGRLAKPVASFLGLSPGIPVAMGTYDAYVDLFGIGVREPGEKGILLGSTAVVGALTTADDVGGLVPDPNGLVAVPYFGDRCLVGGWTSSAGMTLNWARRTFGIDTDDGHLAATLCPGSGGLLALPHLSGERAPIWDAHASGVLLGLDLTSTPLQAYRAFLDGVALSVVDLASRCDAIAPSSLNHWRIAGGGVRDVAWTQATVDALGVSVEGVELRSSAMAAASVAWAAIGSDVVVGDVRGWDPAPSRTERYRRLLDEYRRVQLCLRESMHNLAKMETIGIG